MAGVDRRRDRPRRSSTRVPARASRVRVDQPRATEATSRPRPGRGSLQPRPVTTPSRRTRWRAAARVSTELTPDRAAGTAATSSAQVGSACTPTATAAMPSSPGRHTARPLGHLCPGPQQCWGLRRLFLKHERHRRVRAGEPGERSGGLLCRQRGDHRIAVGVRHEDLCRR